MAIVYAFSIILVTALEFGPIFIKYCLKNRTMMHLKNLFNQKIKSIYDLDEIRYYQILRKIIIYNEYFRHLDIENLIKHCDIKILQKLYYEWNGLKIKKKELFLFYSLYYNLGIFLPIILPISLHIFKSLKRKNR